MILNFCVGVKRKLYDMKIREKRKKIKERKFNHAIDSKCRWFSVSFKSGKCFTFSVIGLHYDTHFSSAFDVTAKWLSKSLEELKMTTHIIQVNSSKNKFLSCYKHFLSIIWIYYICESNKLDRSKYEKYKLQNKILTIQNSRNCVL